MTPAARVQAAIEILDQILSGTAVEKALTNWARRSRFAGSGDRAAIRDYVFHALRRKQSLAQSGGAETGRGLLIGLVREAGQNLDNVFNGKQYAPAELTKSERQGGQMNGECSDMPEWLSDRFFATNGVEAKEQIHLLRDRAPVSLRVNTGKMTIDDAIENLAADGISAQPNPVAATALLVTDGARRIAQSTAYRSGLVEFQDASGQAAIEALHIPNEARVLDYCAGGGGKVLAMAAQKTGIWFAYDHDPRRMADLPVRAKRAGVKITVLNQEGVKAASPYDLILTDVPCSGSGTWRRAPMMKWTLTPKDLNRLSVLQVQIVRDAIGFLKAGGQLVYSTCSVLKEENEDVVQRLVVEHPELSLTTQKRWPITKLNDGFFCAVFVRER